MTLEASVRRWQRRREMIQLRGGSWDRSSRRAWARQVGTKCWMRRGCWAGPCGSVMRWPTPRNSVRRRDTALQAAARLRTGQAKEGKAGTGGQDARHVVARWRGQMGEESRAEQSRLKGRLAARARHDDACVRAWLWGASSGPLAGVSAGWPARLNARAGSVPLRSDLFHPPTSRLCVHWASCVADSA